MRAAHLREAAASAPPYQHREGRRPEQTPLYRVVQQHYETFAAEVEHVATALPQFVKEEFDAYLDCGILAHGFMRLRCEGCARDVLVAFSCKLRGICPSCGTRRMAETAAYLVDRVIPRVPLRQRVLSFPMLLRSLFTIHPKLLRPVLQIINTFLIKQAHVKRSEKRPPARSRSFSVLAQQPDSVSDPGARQQDDWVKTRTAAMEQSL
jgi:hypothetical protein